MLENKFKEIFGYNPDNVFSASGRVNLIGEHVDYCGGMVLRMIKMLPIKR